MRIDGINTGVDFEQYVYSLFASNNIKATDTPKSNDYGADLVVDYDEYRLCVQCKYYSKSVGVKAVQEVMGALSYYQCDFGIVVTNAFFTQQAENLASMNNVLLIDGDELLSIRANKKALSMTLDRFLSQAEKGETISKPSSEWLMNDLVVRYGVSSSKIYKDFLSDGLPFYKVGREYRFVPEEVIEWEIHKKSVPFGKNYKIVLPGYEEYKAEAKRRIKAARKDGDRDKVKQIKREMRKYGIHPFGDYVIGVIIALLVLAVIYLGYGIVQGYYRRWFLY